MHCEQIHLSGMTEKAVIDRNNPTQRAIHVQFYWDVHNKCGIGCYTFTSTIIIILLEHNESVIICEVVSESIILSIKQQHLTSNVR